MDKEWQGYAEVLKGLFELDTSPVAVACLKEPLINDVHKKVRICRAILDAVNGQTIEVNKKNNLCFGASWHLGFHKIKDQRVAGMVKKFVVEGEKLFCSYEALDNLMQQMEEPPDNSGSYFVLAPMEQVEFIPQVVIFVVNAEAASRLLTFVTFTDGIMPKIKIGGPTCRLSIIYPMVTGQVNISFFDYTARKICKVDKDKLLVSIPYRRIPEFIKNIDACSGGRAKVEFPQEFREFLQKRLSAMNPHEPTASS